MSIASLKKFITASSSENAGDDFALAYFRSIAKNAGKDLKKQSEAAGADGYIEGLLLIELKSNAEQWIDGLFQALHYQKKGLAFSTLTIVAHNFVGLWHLRDLPQEVLLIANQTDPRKSASEAGTSNASKCKKNKLHVELYKSGFTIHQQIFQEDMLLGSAGAADEYLKEYTERLQNLDAVRQQINKDNFIRKVELMKPFFAKPIDAIHCFYDIVHLWDSSALVSEFQDGEVQIISGRKTSSRIPLEYKDYDDFKRFVETHYVYVNESLGFTVDYYFSKFDALIARLDQEYVRQHGIFFTDQNLSKFAMWFVREYYERKLAERYIVFDPAGGSGNLVTSWRGHIKHKIVSELNPDLLKIIERRMQDDPEHIAMGFTIIPKTRENRGLNFIEISAEQYVRTLESYLADKNLAFDKPVAFLLNPPYKNTDENASERTGREANYHTDPQIIALTGDDAGRERYLAFCAQIIRISEELIHRNKDNAPLVLIFTPTSWLLPRPTYQPFRKIWDKAFVYEDGFIVQSNQFFELEGRFPIAFTIWRYEPAKKARTNTVKVRDCTHLRTHDLALNWNDSLDLLNKHIKPLLKQAGTVNFANKADDIRVLLPNVLNSNGQYVQQPRFNFYRNLLKSEQGKSIVSGFPLNDERHKRIKAPHGFTDGQFIGFMDDCTPVRIENDTLRRMSHKPDRVWFYLDHRMIALNTNKIFACPPDKYARAAYDYASAEATFLWFGITKALNGRYPVWANQFDLWVPTIPKALRGYVHALCFAFGLAENRCVVTRFEKDNPVPGAPEIFVDNPLAPTNPEAFWQTTLAQYVNSSHGVAYELVDAITNLYTYWNTTYTKGKNLNGVGLKNEPYFKYFGYQDFLTPYSGLIQLRKHAEILGRNDLNTRFTDIREKTRKVIDELHRVLVEDCKYFG